MYELKTIKSGSPTDRPEIQKFKDHSPLLVGIPLFLVGREGDDKMLRTSKIKELDQMHSNIWRFTTSSGSVYELRKI